MDESAIVEQMDDALPLNRAQRALIFDLDGTLVDTVYAQVFRGNGRSRKPGCPSTAVAFHRRVGTSADLFARAAAREIRRRLSEERGKPSRAARPCGG